MLLRALLVILLLPLAPIAPVTTAVAQQLLAPPIPWTRTVLRNGTLVFSQDAVQARVDDPINGRLLSGDNLPTLIVACNAAQATATIEWPMDVAPPPSPTTRSFVVVQIGPSAQALSSSTWVGEGDATALTIDGPARVASWTRQTELVAQVTGVSGRLVQAHFDTRGLGAALRSEGAACANLLH